jgi:hypothetical protein
MIKLHQAMWQDRNHTIMGITAMDIPTNERMNLICKVTDVYNRNPQLHSRFIPIRDVPLDRRLRRSSKQLQEWIQKIDHQEKTTQYLNHLKEDGQLTLHTLTHYDDN